jgi:multiple sugar transport system substrate-binding protein
MMEPVRSQPWVSRARLLRAGPAFLATGVLAGCVPAQSGAGAPSPAAKQFTLIHWTAIARTHPTGAARAAQIEEQADPILERLGLRIVLEEGSTEKAVVASAGGTPPHTQWTEYWNSALLFAPGMTVNPDEALKGDREWAAQRRDIFPAMLETSLWQGKLTAIPGDTNNRGIYFDRAVLSRAGVAPPTPNWTRDEFLEKATRAAAPPERWGFTITPGSLDFLIFYGAAGGAALNKEQTRWSVDNELGRATLQWLQDLSYRRQVVPAPPAGEMMRTGEGKVAFDITGNFRLPDIRKVGVDVGAAPIPVQKARYTMAHGWNLAIFKVPDGDAQRAAARFALWLNSPGFQVPYLIRSDNVPVTRAALEHRDFQAYLARDPVVKVFNEQAPYAFRVPTMPSGRKSELAMSDYIGKALRNEISLADALSQGQRAAQVVLDEDLKQSRA